MEVQNRQNQIDLTESLLPLQAELVGDLATEARSQQTEPEVSKLSSPYERSYKSVTKLASAVWANMIILEGHIWILFEDIRLILVLT